MISNEIIEVVGPALAAGLMIALTHAPLGIEVLRRGIIFIDLAVAQIAGLGLVVGHLFLHDPSPSQFNLVCRKSSKLIDAGYKVPLPDPGSVTILTLERASLKLATANM